MKRLLPWLASLTLLAPTTTLADAKADQILAGVRHVTTLQNNDLTGTLRKGSKRTNIGLFLRGKNIQFQFYQNKKWEKFHIRLNDNKFDLLEMRGTKTFKFSPQKLVQPIAGTDLTYEDLAFRFLYWPNAKLEGSEIIKTQRCHKIRVQNPSKNSKYSIVYIWVHQKYNALMQVVGYDKNGKILKRFHVTKLMTVGKVQTLEQMNVETYNPKTGKAIGITRMQFSKPKAPKPKGL